MKPAIERIRDWAQATHAVVGVIPVRETEAWLLADGDAVRYAFGTTLQDDGLGISSSIRSVEAIADPKAVLEEAYRRTNPTRTRARTGAAAFYSMIFERISLPRLRQVPSFARMEAEILEALRRTELLR